VAIISGATPTADREKIVKQFNAGHLDYLLGQISAMGVSANLQGACNYVAVLEEVPSPGMLQQFVARVYRKGQQHHVQVDLLRSGHDIDVALARLRTEKQTVIDKTIT